MTFSRKVALAAALVAFTTGSAWALTEHEQALYDAAAGEPKLVWYSAHFTQEMTAEIAAAFSAKYPGLEVEGVRATAQVSFQRLLLDLKAGAPQAGVFSSTDISHYPQLKEMGALEAYVPESQKGIVEVYRDLDPEGYYHTTVVSIIGLVYNTEKVSEADAPKNWTDLTDPRWQSQVALGDPNYSGMVGVWTVAMDHQYGWDYFEGLAGIDPQLGRSIDDSVTLLNSGERSVGLGDPSTALLSAQKGNPIAVVYPTDGAVAVTFPSAILKGTASPNTARLFLEFLQGPEVMTIAVGGFIPSIRPDVPGAPGAMPLDQLKVIAPSPDQVAADLAGNKDRWRDTFGM